MASPKPVKVDPQELKKAEELYSHFIEFSKKSIVAAVITLILLAVVFL